MISEITNLKHRGGRPKKLVKREITKGIRFTKAEYFIVKQHASRAGLKITVYVRETALQGKIISRLNEEERQFVRQLIGMANNLNQLTKKGHQEGLLTAVLMFEKYKNLMDELLEKLKAND
ncbi:MAG: plasmid mobilization relaxosome protein MobC [Bacteroidota bacterium]|nr:plasmid mobilization relaxosome protein MobC [Bacteroidota bacterium]